MLIFQKNQEVQQYTGPIRTGFSFTYCSSLNSYIVFGGCKDADVHLFDCAKKKWRVKPTIGKNIPRHCKYHAATVLQHLSVLIVSGGQDQNRNSLDDLFMLSLKEWKWYKIMLLKTPVAREKHSLIPISKTQMLLFGGISMPYNELTNDCWLLTARKELKPEQKSGGFTFDSSQIAVKGAIPDGICCKQSVVIVGQRLICGSFNPKSRQVQLFYLDLKTRVWKKHDLKFKTDELKFYKVFSVPKEETLIASLQQPKTSQPRYFLLKPQSFNLQPLSLHQGSIKPVDFTIDSSMQTQTLCGIKGKRLFTINYEYQQNNQVFQPQGGIEDYLIAIKHQQILSQQLHKKNGLLEDLYKEMQNYITVLNRQYQKYEPDLVVQDEKQRHIEDCQILKSEYTRINHDYQEVVGGIRSLRSELSAINQEFQRCIQTEIDEQGQ